MISVQKSTKLSYWSVDVAFSPRSLDDNLHFKKSRSQVTTDDAKLFFQILDIYSKIPVLRNPDLKGRSPPKSSIPILRDTPLRFPTRDSLLAVTVRATVGDV